MQKMKVNDYCEFPEEINMEPYTQEGLARREKEAKRAEKAEKGEDDDEPTIEPKYPLELYNYKLSGVLVHSGFAEGGHYYSFIKDREDEEGKDRWYEFNDEIVKEFDKTDLESECFGGEEKWSDMMGHSLYIKSGEKHRNAYVLFYERISSEDIPYSDDEDEAKDKKNEHEKEDSSDIHMASENEENVVTDPPLKRMPTVSIKVPDEISEMILEENRKYWQYRFMFSSEYSEFILELCTLWNSRECIPLSYDSRNRDYDILGINEEEYNKTMKEISGKSLCSSDKSTKDEDRSISFLSVNDRSSSDESDSKHIPRKFKAFPTPPSPYKLDGKDILASPSDEKTTPNAENNEQEDLQIFDVKYEFIDPANNQEGGYKSIWDTKARYPNKNIKHLPEQYLLPNESMDMTKKYSQEKIDKAEMEIFKLATTFYLTVKQRAYEKDLIPEFLDLIKAHLNKSLQASRWLISQFSNKAILCECLLQCPVPDMRKL